MPYYNRNGASNTNGWDSYARIYRYKIYTSQDSYQNANSNNSWTLQKVCINTVKSNAKVSNQKMIRFEDSTSVDNYIPNVRSIKIVFINLSERTDSSYWNNLSGIGVMCKQAVYNVPCVIGLGSSSIEPTIMDRFLNQEVCKLFVNSQKCYINYKQNSSIGTNNSSLVKFNLNNIPTENINDISCINIVYRSRMNYSEYNDIDFNEIGLFYSKERIDYLSTASTCNQMFSHGVFNNSWRKNSEQIIDIQYTLCISVD